MIITRTVDEYLKEIPLISTRPTNNEKIWLLIMSSYISLDLLGVIIIMMIDIYYSVQ